MSKLFAKSDEEKKIDKELKEKFAEFWSLFAPEDPQKCKYKVAQNYWCNEMEDYRRAACLKFLRRGFTTVEKNPFYFLQHFTPVRVFLKDREMYDNAKKGVQLCRVRWKDTQPITSYYWAELFGLEILDDHYEKRFINAAAE